MEITEEQRNRSDANRLAALEKRKRAAERVNDDPWRLFRCRKIPSPTTSVPQKKPDPDPITIAPPARFRIFIEICSPTEFSIAPQSLKGFTFPGEFDCFQRIDACLSSVVDFRAIEDQGIRRAVACKINDHDLVLRCLKTLVGVELQDIPHMTLSVVKKFQECVGNQWKPLWKGWYSDEQVDELLEQLPKFLRDALLPFQMEGVRFGLRRGGRCLIADEMGLGKTIQAIAIACCFHDEGPILVVCPAVLRFSWAEELEHWLPFLLPKDIHLVFGHQDNLNHMETSPKVVVISYTMLSRLRTSMLERKWALMIVDESHNMRSTKKKSECRETEALLSIAAKVDRIILLSGTPSLSRGTLIRKKFSPRLLGKDKYEFAKCYCLMKVFEGYQGKIYKDFSKGIRLEELNVLLSQTLMIRRLKEHVLTQLPPKRRQIIRLKLKKADMPQATYCMDNHGVCKDKEHLNEFVNNGCSHLTDGGNESLGGGNVSHGFDTADKECHEKSTKQLSHQEIGLAKLSGFREWFSNHAIIKESEDASSCHLELDCQKMVIFAHHLKILDGIQEFVCEKGIQFVRIDGRTLARDRQTAVESFRLSKEVKIAIIGITAGGVGLDFSSAQNVVFLELPKSASEMLQAEDRAHRRGQTNAVNVYIFCAKDTLDESHWLHLNKSLFRVSSLINGIDDAIREIEVDRILHLDHSIDFSSFSNLDNGIIDGSNGETSIKRGKETIKLNSGIAEDSRGSTSGNIEEEKNSSTGSGPSHFENEDQELDSEDHGLSHGNLEASECQPMHNGQSSTVANCIVDKLSVGCDMIDFMNKSETCEAVRNDADGGSPELVKVDTDFAIQVESLRFEVSQYTGRIHLYICIPGKDTRPRPLHVNFRPEDLELMVLSGNNMKNETAKQLLKENPAYCKIFQTFINEWNGLRPIQKKKLLGKPLQLPLSLEVCYLTESVNHGSGGLLKGGSKRRVTPLSSISSPLPENAVWKKVYILSSTSKEKEYFQAWTSTDEPLCKLCQQQCNGKLAKKPEYFEDLFCKLSCFQEYRIRTSQKALRQELFEIEHGVCTRCKLDCHNLVKIIKPLSISRRKEYIRNVAPKLAEKKKLFEKLVYEPVAGNAWHADHIIPVYNGGGECSLENMRTLCVVCHAQVTKAQQADRKLARRRAKEQLKKALKQLEGTDSTENTNSNFNGIEERDAGGDADEDDLFVIVPGSAYSRRESC